MTALLSEEDRRNLKPILKWAGGKRELAPAIIRHIDRVMPQGMDTYYEPFVGGGAVFFALAALPWRRYRRAVLSDTNRELISLYEAVATDVDGVIRELKRLIKDPGLSREAYNEVRAWKPRNQATRSARTIYLNKLGYNGLYRVNKKGGFNVPYGKYKKPNPLDEQALRAASLALDGVTLLVQPFEQISPTDVDFVYFDPPYLPASKSSDFTAYQADGFGLKDQERLVECLKACHVRGTRFLLSNADTPVARRLYRGFMKKKVLARRSINSVGSSRGPVGELFVWSK